MMDKVGIHSTIEEARYLISDEHEPWKSLAFQVILSKLISDKLPSQADETQDRSQDPGKRSDNNRTFTLEIPEGELLEQILKKSEREKIPIIWCYLPIHRCDC